MRYKFHPEILAESPQAGASNEGGLGKRANIVGVQTLLPGGSTSYTVRIAADESKFTVNRQVVALSHANPGVSSAFLFIPAFVHLVVHSNRCAGLAAQ